MRFIALQSLLKNLILLKLYSYLFFVVATCFGQIGEKLLALRGLIWMEKIGKLSPVAI